MDSFQFIIPSDLRELKTVYAAESYYGPLSGDRPARFVAFFWSSTGNIDSDSGSGSPLGSQCSSAITPLEIWS
jgi:hypothetical protein